MQTRGRRLAVVSFTLCALPFAAARANEPTELERGVEALRKGQAAQAAQLFSSELQTPNRPVEARARAFYLRAKAYAALKQPVLARTDLNLALWLNKLTATEAADAARLKAQLDAPGITDAASASTAAVAPAAPQPAEPARTASNAPPQPQQPPALGDGTLRPWSSNATVSAELANRAAPAAVQATAPASHVQTAPPSQAQTAPQSSNDEIVTGSISKPHSPNAADAPPAGGVKTASVTSEPLSEIETPDQPPQPGTVRNAPPGPAPAPPWSTSATAAPAEPAPVWSPAAVSRERAVPAPQPRPLPPPAYQSGDIITGSIPTKPEPAPSPARAHEPVEDPHATVAALAPQPASPVAPTPPAEPVKPITSPPPAQTPDAPEEQSNSVPTSKSPAASLPLIGSLFEATPSPHEADIAQADELQRRYHEKIRKHNEAMRLLQTGNAR